jgi:hypothetical protein
MYVLFDTETSQYIRKRKPYGTQVAGLPALPDKDRYERKGPAIKLARLRNASRNIPKGRVADKYYSDRPQVVVQQLDANGNIVATHDAPPNYVRLT